MTYLELCQRAVREWGVSTSSTGPSAVTGQTGEMRRVADWIATAYQEICTAEPNWKFLRSSFTFNATSGDNTYLVTDVTDSRLSATIDADEFHYWINDSFRIYLSSAGVATQTYFPFRDYERFRDYWLLASPANARPSEFTVRPDDSAIQLGATPDDTYVITGDYQRMAPALAADADVPLFPSQYHLAIVWLGGMKYARYEEDAGLYQGMKAEYRRVMGDLRLNQLPPMGMGRPLA